MTAQKRHWMIISYVSRIENRTFSRLKTNRWILQGLTSKINDYAGLKRTPVELGGLKLPWHQHTEDFQ
jgi:hypothetical protein